MKRRGELISVGGLFDKYKTLLKPPQESVISVFVEVVFDVVGVSIKKEQVSYSVPSKTVTLHVPSIIKNEIFLKRVDILIHCKGRLGNHSPKDIF
jgi:hypothetical protein